MAKKAKVVLNKENISKYLLHDPAIVNTCYEEAQKIAQRAGDGYAAEKYDKPANNRGVASAYTETVEAMVDNAENGTLKRSIRGPYKTGK